MTRGNRPRSDAASWQERVNAMSEVFVSYSRQDLAFVKELRELLEDADLGVWVDIEGLYAGEEFWPEVVKAIDAAAVVVFVITPHSLASPVCGQELNRAVASQKRVVPLYRNEVDTHGLPSALADRQWVFFRQDDDRQKAREDLLSAVRADWVWLREQGRLLRRAREWEEKQSEVSLLLRGRDLRDAEGWLERGREREYGATPLHGKYIRASRDAAAKRRLRLTGAAAVALLAIIVVGWFGLSQRVASLNNLSLDDLSRGAATAAIDKLERASGICAKFGSVFAGCSDAGLNLGRAYLDAGRFSEALRQFSRAVDEVEETSADDEIAAEFRATAYQNRAYTRIMLAEMESEETARLAEYQRAEDDLDAAAVLYERTPAGAAGRPVALTRARIDIGRGEYAKALEELDRASRVSDAPDIDLLLSVVHHCLGDGMKSLTHFRLYIDDLPGGLQNPRWLLDKAYYTRVRERCISAVE